MTLTHSVVHEATDLLYAAQTGRVPIVGVRAPTAPAVVVVSPIIKS
jgi:hypothetical protein